ncbi:MAG: hypothetical protein L0I08_10820, partial [Enterobacterales bacterium]|nr:hypothetical protein [Enterobacterales bacterium]
MYSRYWSSNLFKYLAINQSSQATGTRKIMSKPILMERGVKYRDADKMALIPVKTVAVEREQLLRKPEWMKIKLPADSSRIQGIKAAMRKNGLHSVCEEAS